MKLLDEGEVLEGPIACGKLLYMRNYDNFDLFQAPPCDQLLYWGNLQLMLIIITI